MNSLEEAKGVLTRTFLAKAVAAAHIDLQARFYETSIQFFPYLKDVFETCKKISELARQHDIKNMWVAKIDTMSAQDIRELPFLEKNSQDITADDLGDWYGFTIVEPKNEKIYLKLARSACKNTDFATDTASLQTIIIDGIYLTACIKATIIDLLNTHTNLNVIVVTDGTNTTRTPEEFHRMIDNETNAGNRLFFMEAEEIEKTLESASQHPATTEQNALA